MSDQRRLPCPVCGNTYMLTLLGRVRAHKALGFTCSGSGELPARRGIATVNLPNDEVMTLRAPEGRSRCYRCPDRAPFERETADGWQPVCTNHALDPT